MHPEANVDSPRQYCQQSASTEAALRARSESTAPSGWSAAFELAGLPVPEPPTSWPYWYAAADVRIRLADALNVIVEQRRESGTWAVLAYCPSFDAAVASARRRGLVPAGIDAPRDARRWPYGVVSDVVHVVYDVENPRETRAA